MAFSGWGARFRVGWVPVAEYLTNDQVDEIGFTNRTFSLMSDPEAYFDDANPADFALFGVRFLIYPAGHKTPPGTRLLQRAGAYELWILPHDGYVQVVDTYGPALVEDRAHLGADSASFVQADRAGEGLYPVVAFGGRSAATPTLASPKLPKGPAGEVIRQSDDLADGLVRVTVRANRTAVVLLKATFDPGCARHGRRATGEDRDDRPRVRRGPGEPRKPRRDVPVSGLCRLSGTLCPRHCHPHRSRNRAALLAPPGRGQDPRPPGSPTAQTRRDDHHRGLPGGSEKA